MTLPQLLTTREIAQLLRIKERKVYELAADNTLPVLRVTGKLLFPLELVEQWLKAHIEYAPTRPRLHTRPKVVSGSHDPLLEWALRESATDVANIFEGSSVGLERFARGEAIMAGMHLYDVASDSWNIAAIRQKLPGADVALVEFAKRRQGLMMLPSTSVQPTQICEIGDRRFIQRQSGAGAQILFDVLRTRAGLPTQSLTYCAEPARSEMEVGLAISDGRADIGFGVEAVARQLRLDFAPLVEEDFDLLVWRKNYFDTAIQQFLKFCRGDAFATRAASFGGYDISTLGRVKYNAP